MGCSVQCAVFSVQCAVCSGKCAVCSVKFAVCSLLCAVYWTAQDLYRVQWVYAGPETKKTDCKTFNNKDFLLLIFSGLGVATTRAQDL